MLAEWAEDMVNAGIGGAEGVKFTQEIKEKMAQWLKQCMVQKRLKASLTPSYSFKL